MRGKRLRRVDVQVSIFTAIIVIFSSTCICIFNYKMSYNNMINSLRDQVFSINNYVKKNMDVSVLHKMNSKNDETKKEYIETKKLLERIKGATNVWYLYTVKENDNGEFIYVVDGLRESNKDFKHVGDPVKKNIIPDIKKALSGEVILPDKIKDTDAGKKFVTYLPIYEKEKIIGVLGIGLRAEYQYNTFLAMRIVSPIIALIACIISVLLAVKIFRRISNPNYRDLYNTDQLTQLKNRNAYDTDIKNIIATGKQKNLGVIVVDLNSLKYINDSLGHQTGDEYIRCASKALKDSMCTKNVIYRTGGDEFVVLVHNAIREEIENIITSMKSCFKTSNINSSKNPSMAVGYALYNENVDSDINDTYYRADRKMYEDKKRYYRNE